MKYCLNCGKELSGSQVKFCGATCQARYFHNQYIERWKNGEETGLKGSTQLSDHIKKYMFEKYNFKCEKCGWGEINQFTQKIPLEIHHIDGNYKNCSEDNLQLLCPNCHALTENYKGANSEGRKTNRVTRKAGSFCVDCGKEISFGSTRCRECANKARVSEIPVSREELKKLIRNNPFTKIGEQFSITDNAIRKWCDKYGLPRKKTEINLISDEDWENI